MRTYGHQKYYRDEKFRTKNHCGAKYLAEQRCEATSPNWHKAMQGNAQLRNMKQEQDRRPRKERSINAVLFWYSTDHQLKTRLKIMIVSNSKKLQKALFNTHTTVPVAGCDVACCTCWPCSSAALLCKTSVQSTNLSLGGVLQNVL